MLAVAIGVRSWNAEWNDTSDAASIPVNTWMSSHTLIEPRRELPNRRRIRYDRFITIRTAATQP